MLSDDFHKYLANPELLNEETLPELKELVQKHPSFQLAWMLLLKNLKLLEAADFELYLERGAFYVTDRRRLFYFLQDNSEKESKKAEREFETLSGEYLKAGNYQLESDPEPDESLADLARSLRRKATVKEENAEEQAQADEAPEFVTETLAKIYVRQGMYKQAISAYQKLSLKYPEKNIYFAGQIEEVKKLMN